jgi:hypothetical protein
LKSHERECNAALAAEVCARKKGSKLKSPRKKIPFEPEIRSCRIRYSLSNAKPLNETEGVDIERGQGVPRRNWYLRKHDAAETTCPPFKPTQDEIRNNYMTIGS